MEREVNRESSIYIPGSPLNPSINILWATAFLIIFLGAEQPLQITLYVRPYIGPSIPGINCSSHRLIKNSKPTIYLFSAFILITVDSDNNSSVFTFVKFFCYKIVWTLLVCLSTLIWLFVLVCVCLLWMCVILFVCVCVGGAISLPATNNKSSWSNGLCIPLYIYIYIYMYKYVYTYIYVYISFVPNK